MADSDTNSIDLKSGLCLLADELGHLVLREHQILQVEMKQLGSLIGDAVRNLDSNFRDLNACSIEQAEIIGRMVDDGCVDEQQRHRLTEISESISSHTSATIRLLQFDDIVQQLAGHACDRIARMQELFNEIDSMLESIKVLDKTQLGEIAHQLHTMKNEIGRFREGLEKENPVRQDSMQEGKIELF